MNLQGRIASGLLFGAALVLFGCESPSEVGLELNPNENNIGVYEEVFTLPSSVILFDSLNTTNDSRLLVGRFKDPLFGEITAKSFSQVTRDGEEVAINPNGVLDFIEFNLAKNYIYGVGGDNFQTINIYQLTDTLYSGVSYYSDDITDYTTKSPAASRRFLYSSKEDTINVTANTSWASNFFEIIRNGTTTLELTNEIKGFALIPSQDNTMVFGFNPTNSHILVHYHLSTDTASLTYKINFGSAVRYNNVTVDRTGTELEALKETSDELAPASGNLYLQGGTGIYTKISLEPYRKFVDSLGNIIINRAELKVGGINGLPSSDQQISPLNSLKYIFADSTNRIVRTNAVVLSDVSYSSNTTPVQLLATYDSITRSYVGTPTFFFQLLRDSVFDVNDLIIYPGATTTVNDVTSLNRYVVSKDSIQLKIFYTRLQ